MATKDNSPGLLSKVAMFVRNPTTNWSDLDQMETATDSAFSKQALKEMIERKRQNDFVRKREFDQLRKLRKRGGADLQAEVGRPSFFHSSLSSSSDDRASTLKKIDEIEAHMSKQWWKGKQEEEAETPPRASVAPASRTPVADAEHAPVTVAPEIRASRFVATEAASLYGETRARGARDFSDTQAGTSALSGDARASISARNSDTKTAYGAEQPPAQRPRVGDVGGAGFSTSRLYAGESDDATTDPELEEAAIRFANGDDTGAETGLLGALRGGSVSRESAGIWTAALFDLYRATGQQMKFEGVAVEFAERFGRSAPAWFSMPEMLGHGAPAVQISISPGLEPDAVLWKSPARLNTESVGELRLAIANVTSPWHLDWTPIVSIHVDAVPPLGRLFSTWCTQDVLLRFSGAQALEQVLRPLTVSGDSSCDPLWWRLRMDALRIMRRQDEFELVALDFCVTYEVSPPSWQLPRCEYAQEGVGEGNSLASPLMQQSGFAGLDPDPRNALTAPMSLEPSGAVLVELVGEILGDAAAALEKLETSRRGSKRLVVSCSKLIRVDFAAAGTILNWVAAREGEGCQVQFRDMHRLVAAFFNVIGIHEHASVIRRMT